MWREPDSEGPLPGSAQERRRETLSGLRSKGGGQTIRLKGWTEDCEGSGPTRGGSGVSFLRSCSGVRPSASSCPPGLPVSAGLLVLAG